MDQPDALERGSGQGENASPAPTERRAATERRLTDALASLQSLTELSETATDFAELAHATLSQVVATLGGVGGSYGLITPDDDVVETARVEVSVAFSGWPTGRPASSMTPIRRLHAGWDAHVRSYDDPAHSDESRTHAAQGGILAYAALPVRVDDALEGVMLVYFDRPAAGLAAESRVLGSIARTASISLANFRLRERLSASEARYRTLFEQSPDALLIETLDDHVVVGANPAAAQLFGAEPAGLVGLNAKDLVEIDPAGLAAHGARVREQGRATFVATGRRLDGSTFPEEVAVTVIELGGEAHLLVLVRDLTDRERLQQELLQAQKMEAIGQLVSGVAHELNNPLASIVAFSQLIRRDERLPDELRHDADLLVQEADRTRRIVQNLLDFARQRPPERYPTRLGALVQSVLDLLAYGIRDARIDVVIDIPAEVPPVPLDRAQIQQVVLNLTWNAIHAIRATKQPGRIDIVARSAGSDGDRVRLTVLDDGPGVPLALRPKLFLPFFTTREPGEGTGLGLSVSFGIIAAHGGQLSFEPGPNGRGAAFTVELPLEVTVEAATDLATTASIVPEADRPGGPVGQREASRGAAAVTDRHRALVLDDEPAIRTFLARVLQLAGFDAVLAGNGREAVEQIGSTEFAAILCDYRMPGMSGTDVYNAVVERRPDLRNRFVFMSGDVLNPELRDFAADHGVRLLAKPFDLETVQRVVRSVASDDQRG